MKVQRIGQPLRVELDGRFGDSVRFNRRKSLSPEYAFSRPPVVVIGRPFRADQLELGQDKADGCYAVDDHRLARVVAQLKCREQSRPSPGKAAAVDDDAIVNCGLAAIL